MQRPAACSDSCLERPFEMSSELRTLMDALRAWSKSSDLNQVVLIEGRIDEYLKANGSHLPQALERLRNCIHEEEGANRGGEDWSIARSYVRRMLHTYSLIFEAKHSEERFEGSEAGSRQPLLQSLRRRSV
jgi:hypothetical protein